MNKLITLLVLAAVVCNAYGQFLYSANLYVTGPTQAPKVLVYYNLFFNLLQTKIIFLFVFILLLRLALEIQQTLV